MKEITSRVFTVICFLVFGLDTVTVAKSVRVRHAQRNANWNNIFVLPRSLRRATKVDLCVPNPCQNGGTCNSGQCTCPPGFDGPHCESERCSPACQNGGTCRVGQCICPPKFQGLQCQDGTVKTHSQTLAGSDIFKLAARCFSPCENGGTCRSGQCVCPPNFHGPQCQDERCSPPCRNGGTCRSGQCFCRPNFHGPQCEDERCSPPCRNGGTCRSGKCSCSPGFHGAQCQSTCIRGASGDHSSCRATNSPDLISINTVNDADAVDAHNHARRSPRLKPTPNPALPTVLWNFDLAWTAERYAAQCNFIHDRSDQREVFSTRPAWGRCVGQNIFASTTDSVPVTLAVADWFSEINDWAYGQGAVAGKQVGRFTQVIWNETLFVGCGSATCSKLHSAPPTFRTVIVCNYGPCGNSRTDWAAFPYSV